MYPIIHIVNLSDFTVKLNLNRFQAQRLSGCSGTASVLFPALPANILYMRLIPDISGCVSVHPFQPERKSLHPLILSYCSQNAS